MQKRSIASSSGRLVVATTVASIAFAARVRVTTCPRMGISLTSTSVFPGRRVEPIRAWMIATTRPRLPSDIVPRNRMSRINVPFGDPPDDFVEVFRRNTRRGADYDDFVRGDCLTPANSFGCEQGATPGFIELHLRWMQADDAIPQSHVNLANSLDHPFQVLGLESEVMIGSGETSVERNMLLKNRGAARDRCHWSCPSCRMGRAVYARLVERGRQEGQSMRPCEIAEFGMPLRSQLEAPEQVRDGFSLPHVANQA